MKKIFLMFTLLIGIGASIYEVNGSKEPEGSWWSRHWKKHRSKYLAAGAGAAAIGLGTAAYLNRERLSDTYGNARRSVFGLNKYEQENELYRKKQLFLDQKIDAQNKEIEDLKKKRDNALMNTDIDTEHDRMNSMHSIKQQGQDSWWSRLPAFFNGNKDKSKKSAAQQEKKMHDKAQGHTYRTNKEKQRQRTEELNQRKTASPVPFSQRIGNRVNKFFKTAEEGRQLRKTNRREMKDYVHGTVIPTAKNAFFDVTVGTQGTEAIDRLKAAQNKVERRRILRKGTTEERKNLLLQEERDSHKKWLKKWDMPEIPAEDEKYIQENLKRKGYYER